MELLLLSNKRAKFNTAASANVKQTQVYPQVRHHPQTEAFLLRPLHSIHLQRISANRRKLMSYNVPSKGKFECALSGLN